MELDEFLDGEALTLRDAGIICTIWMSVVTLGALALTFGF